MIGVSRWIFGGCASFGLDWHCSEMAEEGRARDERHDEREHMHSGESGQTGAVNRGRLKNGNPAGDPSTSPRCGARTRSGKPCRSPAMWSKIGGRYTRCRIHGGASTGPRTAAGLDKCRRTNWKNGAHTAESVASRREQQREQRFLYKLAPWLLERAKLDAEGNLLPMVLTEFKSEIDRELRLFWVATVEGRSKGFVTPAQNLMRLAERILGYRVTRAADDTVEARRMDTAERMAVFEECLLCLPRDVAEQLRARARGARSTHATI